MCGLAGWIDYQNIDFREESDHLERMSAALERRGPDARGEYIGNNAALLHRRLIVIDPEGGAQPMSVTVNGETYTMVYNGELYNTEELRSELKAAGHVFLGRSDTEVLLLSYAEWGKDCLEKLNGIYAFAVWEERANRLFAARDRVGVKPFFYACYEGGMVFASEIKALFESGQIIPELDADGWRQLLFIGPGRSGGSGVLKGVEELLPGEYLYFDRGGIQKELYWRLVSKEHLDNPVVTVERTKDLIYDAVTRQLVSDVPLACFLSGGLDSSIISMIAAKKYKREGLQLTTYSVDYKDNDKYFVKNSFQPDADNQYISTMSEFIGSNHINIALDSLEVAKSLDEAQDARGLPGMADIDSSLLLFCREIKKHNTVCVSGECADEIFGGYPWYHNREILFTPTFPWSNSVALREKLFNPPFNAGGVEFVDYHYQKTVKAADVSGVTDPYERRMREMFQLNFYWFMQTLLDRKDRMSMYSGLEVRVPFCDHRLVEYAYNMPWKYKALYGREKGVVREAFKDMLPDEIVWRKKSPYPKTFNPVFLSYVKERATKLVYNKTSPLYGLVNKKFFDELETVDMPAPWYGQLMRLPQIYAYLIQLDGFLKAFHIEI